MKSVTKAKTLLDEFKTFIIKGNALDLAIGVVIGAAFNEMVNSLVKDIILGLIANIAKQPDFSTWAWGAVKYGAFINSLINLMVVGFSVFIAIKAINRLGRIRKHEEAAEAAEAKTQNSAIPASSATPATNPTVINK